MMVVRLVVVVVVLVLLGDMAQVARGLLEPPKSLGSKGLGRKAASFYGHVFEGMDVDGSGSISYQEIRDGTRVMGIDISDSEISAHFLACGTDELDRDSVPEPALETIPDPGRENPTPCVGRVEPHLKPFFFLFRPSFSFQTAFPGPLRFLRHRRSPPSSSL